MCWISVLPPAIQPPQRTGGLADRNEGGPPEDCYTLDRGQHIGGIVYGKEPEP